LTETPELSVVIASVNGRPYLSACLAALSKQSGSVATEILVADCVGPSVTDFVRAEYPHVKLISFGERKSVPELRAAGILASSGRLVAITEDHCIPEPDWTASLVAAHGRSPAAAIGGAVDNAATDRLIDWAVFFCEYSNFISPVVDGLVHDLPGPNVSYKRAALGDLQDMLREGYWETFLHTRLEAGGQELRSDPTVRVLHKKHFGFWSFFQERFAYGRAYAGTRNEFVSRGRRLYYLVFSPALPALLVLRIGRRVLSRGRHLREFVRALPVVVTFMLAWAAGEFVGYAIGPGEAALQLT
jgi:glycosyltransferase involved in cell wall biosynthesis